MPPLPYLHRRVLKSKKNTLSPLSVPHLALCSHSCRSAEPRHRAMQPSPSPPGRQRQASNLTFASPSPLLSQRGPHVAYIMHRQGFSSTVGTLTPPTTVLARQYLQELGLSASHRSNTLAGAIDLQPVPLPPFPIG
jgi:hypothetical protein